MTFSHLVLGEQGILHGGGRLFIVMENSECTLPVCDSHNYPLTHVSTHIRVCSKKGAHDYHTIMIILVIKIFFVQFFYVFLPPRDLGGEASHSSVASLSESF